MTNKKAQSQKSETEAAKKPDWVVKTPLNSKLVRIGAAWDRESDGGICIRLSGKQVIEGDVYLFPNTPYAEAGAR